MLENFNIRVSETRQNKRHMTVTTTAAAVITTYNINEKEEKTEKQ